jgi:hypothetical protein
MSLLMYAKLSKSSPSFAISLEKKSGRGKQKGQRGQERQKVLFAFLALFALFASPEVFFARIEVCYNVVNNE